MDYGCVLPPKTFTLELFSMLQSTTSLQFQPNTIRIWYLLHMWDLFQGHFYSIYLLTEYLCLHQAFNTMSLSRWELCNFPISLQYLSNIIHTLKDQKFALKIAHVWHMPAFIEYLNEMDWGDGLQQFRWCDIAKILGGNCSFQVVFVQFSHQFYLYIIIHLQKDQKFSLSIR